VVPPFDNPASIHGRELALVGTNKRVLELGCSFGHTSAELTRRGCKVTGVELDPAAAARAEEWCERVVVADLEAIDLREAFGDERFDVALCGDVLEHLKDPVATLRQIVDLLAPEGYVVASIPNVAHGSIRLALLQGRFEYRELGLLDRTHIHLFTKATIESTFRDAGMVICELQEVPVGIFETEIPVRREDFDPAVVEALEADPSALTYEFLVKATIDDGTGIVEDLRRRNDELQAEIVQTQLLLLQQSAKVDEITRWAEHLMGERDAAQAEVARLRSRPPARGVAGRLRRAVSGR
jgi:2-polyprenyl-3-methyl-5-hydroxy-6-metoxy-1,4-benzoquinol methylase